MDIKKIIRQLTLKEKASLVSGQGYWHTKAIKDKNVPAMMMCDGPIGLRKQNNAEDNLGLYDSVKTVCFPSTSTLANSFDRQVTNKLGTTLGKECQSENVQMLLGPGMNIKRNVLGGRNFEYYSEDPYVTGELASSYIKGLQSQGVSACAKHFACNSQETYRMAGNSIVEERPLHEIYLAGFEKAVKKAQPKAIMCAYNALNGTFCAENKKLLTDTLRNNWGFKGTVVTDWGAIKDRVKGLQAGVDLEMPDSHGSQDQDIINAVKSGKLDEKVLDQAVYNVLKLVDETLTHHKKTKGDLAADHQVAIQLAVNSAVLMKNDHQVLPLKKEQKVAFIGDFAKKPRYQGGGSSHVNAFHVDNALDWAKANHLSVNYAQGYDQEKDQANSELEQEAVDLAKNVDVAVIFAGLPERYESEGQDRQTMAMPKNQNSLIQAVAKVQQNTVVVLHTGSAVTMPWQNKVPAILNMGLAGEGVGSATGKLLYGQVNPSGKLAESYPIKLSDSPSYLNFPGEEGTVHYRENIFVGYRYYDKKEMKVAFPFGSGLSYTTFKLDNLQLSQKEINDQEKVKASCTVTNTGKVAGQTIVQLYTSLKHSQVLRPVRELKEFTKVQLAPGESKKISFILDQEAFRYWNEQIHDWHVESGDYQIEIGFSSRDLKLQSQLHVDSTKTIPVHYTKYTAIAKVANDPAAQDLLLSVMRTMIHIKEDDYQKKSKAEKAKIDGQCKQMITMASSMTLMSLVSLGSVPLAKLNDLIDHLNGKK